MADLLLTELVIEVVEQMSGNEIDARFFRGLAVDEPLRLCDVSTANIDAVFKSNLFAWNLRGDKPTMSLPFGEYCNVFNAFLLFNGVF